MPFERIRVVDAHRQRLTTGYHYPLGIRLARDGADCICISCFSDAQGNGFVHASIHLSSRQSVNGAAREARIASTAQAAHCSGLMPDASGGKRMQFSFTGEQEEFRSVLRRFLEEKSPPTTVRR